MMSLSFFLHQNMGALVHCSPYLRSSMQHVSEFIQPLRFMNSAPLRGFMLPRCSRCVIKLRRADTALAAHSEHLQHELLVLLSSPLVRYGYKYHLRYTAGDHVHGLMQFPRTMEVPKRSRTAHFVFREKSQRRITRGEGNVHIHWVTDRKCSYTDNVSLTDAIDGPLVRVRNMSAGLVSVHSFP